MQHSHLQGYFNVLYIITISNVTAPKPWVVMVVVLFNSVSKYLLCSFHVHCLRNVACPMWDPVFISLQSCTVQMNSNIRLWIRILSLLKYFFSPRNPNVSRRLEIQCFIFVRSLCFLLLCRLSVLYLCWNSGFCLPCVYLGKKSRLASDSFNFIVDLQISITPLFFFWVKKALHAI